MIINAPKSVLVAKLTFYGYPLQKIISGHGLAFSTGFLCKQCSKRLISNSLK